MPALTVTCTFPMRYRDNQPSNRSDPMLATRELKPSRSKRTIILLGLKTLVLTILAESSPCTIRIALFFNLQIHYPGTWECMIVRLVDAVYTSFPGILQPMNKLSCRLQWRHPHDITARPQNASHILQTLRESLEGGCSIQGGSMRVGWLDCQSS